MHCGVGEYTRFLAFNLKSTAPWIEVKIFTSTRLGKNLWKDPLGNDVIPIFEERDRNYSELLDQLKSIGGLDILHVQHEYGIFGKGSKLLEILRKIKEEGLVRRAVITLHTVLHYGSQDERTEFQKGLNIFDAIIVHSILQEFELQWQGLESKKIYRIPHGTFINPYLGHPRTMLAKSLGIKEESLKGVIIAVPGFLRQDKGLDVLFNSLLNLLNLSTTIIVAGEPKDKYILDLIEQVSSKLNVIFVNRYLSGDEILRIIGLADVLALPYRNTPGTLSVSGILHLSMGGLKPIVGSRVPRLVELYQFAPRLTVPSGDPIELARKLRWVIENYDYAVAYMSILYSYAARTQWPRITRRHEELYRNLLSLRTEVGSKVDDQDIPPT